MYDAMLVYVHVYIIMHEHQLVSKRSETKTSTQGKIISRPTKET